MGTINERGDVPQGRTGTGWVGGERVGQDIKDVPAAGLG